MGLLNWLRGIVGKVQVPPHEYLDSDLLFPELDLDRMTKKMGIIDEGSSRGVQNQPPTDHDSLDDIENRIITAIHTEIRVSHEKATNHIHAYKQRLSALKIGTHLGQFVSSTDAACTDFNTSVQRDRDSLFHLRQEVTAINRDFDRFRMDHQLSRLPQYPLSLLRHWGLIAVLVLLESVLNGSLLARGLSFGVLGGVTYALIIAILNVGVGYAAGRFVFANFYHRHGLRRALAGCAFVGWMFFTFAFNLTVAHYRAALGGENPGEAERIALQTVRSQPFNIPEISGWILLFMGIAFSIVAAVDGLRMDDPYPGYGKIARRRDQITQDYSDQKERLISDLKEIRNSAIARVDALGGELETRREQHKTIQQNINRCIQLFRTHLAYLEQCANTLLSNYRQANRTARTTAPPAHFSQAWHLGTAPDLELVGITEDLDPALEQRMNDALKELGTARQRINEAFESAVSEFKGLEELSTELAHGV